MTPEKREEVENLATPPPDEKAREEARRLLSPDLVRTLERIAARDTGLDYWSITDSQAREIFAALSTARAEGREEAAKLVESHIYCTCLRDLKRNDDTRDHYDMDCRAQEAIDSAAAIRALPIPPPPAEEGESPERTLKSLAVMLGWMNLPPRETLEREINALKARAGVSSDWRDIASAPKDGSFILGCYELASGHAFTVAYWDEAGWFNHDVYVEPTHWLPLPPPPSAEGATQGGTCEPLGHASAAPSCGLDGLPASAHCGQPLPCADHPEAKDE